MVLIQNLKKQYGLRTILDGISFTVNEKEKVGIVGRNGHGKTTLFRMIAGEETWEDGSIIIPKNYRIGFLKQIISFSHPSVLAQAASGLQIDSETETWKAKKVLMGLGFAENDFDRSPFEFSGGYQMRINLAMVLLSEPDLLLLDEPTNFLDIVSIRWLTDFLRQWKREFLVISHDRGFLDNVCSHILGINRKKVKKVAGITNDYFHQIFKEEEHFEKERQNQEKRKKQIELFISRFRAKARQANLAQSRMKTLQKLNIPEKLERSEQFSFSFNEAILPAKYYLRVNDLCFSYPNSLSLLIENFSLTVEKDDKICIIGKNGKGKTTLLKLLAEVLTPVSGSVQRHPLTKTAYYEQGNTAKLNGSLTVEEEIALSFPVGERSGVRDVCGAMMFSGDDALKKIDVLSGGERARVLLGKIMATPSNLLLLDEPTHHLDMESCEALIEAIQAYQGATIIVTHDENMLLQLATKLIIFLEDRLLVYPGTYQDFLEQVSWENMTPQANSVDEEPQKVLSKKEIKKMRAEFVLYRSKILSPFKTKVEKLEKEIEKSEESLSMENQALVKACETQNASQISVLSQSVKQIAQKVEAMYLDLAAISDEYEKLKKNLDEEEKNLP